MLRRISSAAVPALVGLIAASATLSAQDVVIEHNGSSAPACCAWGPNVIGFDFTPTASFFLSMIETRFSLAPSLTYAARTITTEIRDAAGGNILGSASFGSSASASDWVGGSFDPVLVEAGTTYFIDFLNVGNNNNGLAGINVINSSPTNEFGAIQYGATPESLGNQIIADPIVRLTGSTFGPELAVTATPEPATMTLVATGLAGMVGMVRRRRKHGQIVA